MMIGNSSDKHEFGMLDYTGTRDPFNTDEGMHDTFIDDANSTSRDCKLAGGPNTSFEKGSRDPSTTVPAAPPIKDKS